MLRKLLALVAVLTITCLPYAWAQISIVGPANIIACNLTEALYIPTAGQYGLVTESFSNVNRPAQPNIFVCGWHVTSIETTTTTFSLEYGVHNPGTPCGASPTSITPAANVTNTAPSADHIDYASFQVPNPYNIGEDLCVVTAGSPMGMSVLVYYAQF